MQKDIPALFRSLSKRGLGLSIKRDGNLLLTGPKENRTQAHREFIAAHKEEILAILWDREEREVDARTEWAVALVRDAIEAAAEGRMVEGERMAVSPGVTTTEPGKCLLWRYRLLRSMQDWGQSDASILATEIFRIAQWWDDWQIQRFLSGPEDVPAPVAYPTGKGDG